LTIVKFLNPELHIPCKELVIKEFDIGPTMDMFISFRIQKTSEKNQVTNVILSVDNFIMDEEKG
jgi:hypothetical protein